MTKMRLNVSHALTLLLGAVLLFGGCELIGSDDGESESEQNLRLWTDNTDGDYRFDLVRGCFCRNAGTFRITVLDFSIVSVSDLTRGEQVPVDQFSDFATIEEIFGIIEDAHQAGADRIDVTYDGTLGYPVETAIDFRAQVSDDELFLGVDNIQFDVRFDV